ncbi:ribonuclease P protein component [Candidatus Falkowbacteria bacterium]|nr:ribonuclease P protein component [Candidatus Falkowbacteria bacterium]
MKDFEILVKEGRFVNGKFLNAKIWKIEPDKYPRRKYTTDDLRIGFAVGLGVSKKATARNRIKRQLREVVRLLLKDNKIKRGYHVLVIAKGDVVGKEYGEIEREVGQILKDIKY